MNSQKLSIHKITLLTGKIEEMQDRLSRLKHKHALNYSPYKVDNIVTILWNDGKIRQRYARVKRVLYEILPPYYRYEVTPLTTKLESKRRVSTFKVNEENIIPTNF